MNRGHFKKSLVYGFGIDDTDYQKERRVYSGNTSKLVWYCEAYSRWKNMVKRCYFGADSSYLDKLVDSEWIYFSKFKAWYESQDKPVGKYHLDKDLLGGRLGIYSQDTCCLLPQKINQFLASKENKNSNTLIGTWYDKGRDNYQAYCCSFGTGRKCLGRFSTEHEANIAWQRHKVIAVNDCINWYKTEYEGFVETKVLSGLSLLLKNLEINIKQNLPLKELKF